MLISFLVAAAENDVIGKNNQLPWHLPNDMKFFKNTSWAMPVIMGRKTFDSFKKPLAGRRNIVITRQADWQREGVIVKNNIEEALKAAAETDAKETFVIGGGELFKELMPRAGRIYLTRVHANPDGDTFFPTFSLAEWKLISQLDMQKDEKHKYDYSFQTWERKTS